MALTGELISGSWYFMPTETLPWCHVKRTDSLRKLTDPDWSVALSKVIILLVYSSEDVECPLTRERKQWKNPISIFKSVRVRIRECPLTGTRKCRVCLGGKNGNWKKCPQVELSAYERVRWRRVDCILFLFPLFSSARRTPVQWRVVIIWSTAPSWRSPCRRRWPWRAAPRWLWTLKGPIPQSPLIRD